MRLLRNTEIKIEPWNILISQSKNSSPFQTWEFVQLYNSLERSTAEVFAVEIANVLKALCVVTIQKEDGVKSFFSSRGIVYGGPVFKDSTEPVIEFLFYHIYRELVNKVIYLEVRNYEDYADLKSFYVKNGWKFYPYMNFKLTLKDNSFSDMLGYMKYNRRREIKLSVKEGATFREALTYEEVQSLYLILKSLYKKKVRLPLPEFSFFVGLFRSAIGKVFVAIHDKKIIGGSFCFYQKNKCIYLMYYCGLRDYHPRIFPTHLSILAAIDFGIKEKLSSVDLMGAGIEGKKYGVRDYKQEFGGELNIFGRYRKICNKTLFIIGELGLKTLRLFK